MFRKIVILVVLTAIFAGLAYAGGRFVKVDYGRLDDSGTFKVRVKISVDNQGGWLGCSFFTNDGREDLDPKYVVGEDVVVYEIPQGSYKCEVALYRENWNRGDGPDPENAWAIKNGYYLWDELDRETISLSR